jgi:hypothetical protein
MGGATASSPGRFWRGVGTLRPRVRTTPGRLRLVAVAITLGAVGFGLIGVTAAITRRDAALTAAGQTEPLLVQAVRLHDALSDADATASATFVIGGAEPPARRRRYLADVETASSALAVVGRQTASSPETAAAVVAIGRELPVYTGLIEAARTNNRQGFPVGAAYLRRASTLMRERMLPAAAQVYAVEGRELNSRYRAGAGSAVVMWFAGAGLVMLVLLAGAQVYLVRLTRRRLNLPLLAGTMVLVGAAAWGLLGLAGEQRALMRAQRDGSDPVEVLSGVRVLALRAQADEGLSLAARGSGDASPADFETTMRMLGGADGSSGLLGEAATIARRQNSSADVTHLEGRFAAYRRVHARVVALESQGRFNAAADLSVGARGRELSLADAIRHDLDRLIAASQRRFETAAGEAGAAVRGRWLAIPVLTVTCALLALYGVRLRMNEYR